MDLAGTRLRGLIALAVSCVMGSYGRSPESRGSFGECVLPEWDGVTVPPAIHGTTWHSNGLGQKERHGNIATERVRPRA